MAYARIEGVEDLDLIVRRDDSWVEQYVQVKSKEEGTGNWTIRSLEEEGIFSRFFRLFKDFHASPHDTGRGIELVLVVEGDLVRELRRLREDNRAKAQILSLLMCMEIAELSAAYKPSITTIRDFLRTSAPTLTGGGLANEQSGWDDLSQRVAKELDLAPEEIKSALTRAEASAAEVLDDFLDVLVFQSRTPGIELLKEAAIKRLMEAADIGVLEGEAALGRLVQNIANESSKPVPTLIDNTVLLSWLGLRPKPSLRSKPEVVADFIERT